MKRCLVLLLVVLLVPVQFLSGIHSATAAPLVSVTPNPAAQGSTVHINGSGFRPSGPGAAIVVCTNIPVATQCWTVPVSASGTFSTSLAIPPATVPGRYQISAQQFSEDPVYASLTVGLSPPPPAPTVSVTPNPVAPGNILTVKGSGWPRSSQVNICISIPSFSCQTVSTSSDGTFSIGLVIAAGTPSGTYTVSVQWSTATPITTQVQVQVPVSTKISLNTVPVSPGQAVGVTGSGFGDGEQVRVSFPALLANNTTASQQVLVVADAGGNFSVGLPIPGSTVPGNYIVKAVGLRTGLQATALLNVAAQPTLSVSPGTVPVGGSILISGQRWESDWSVTVTAVVPLVNGGSQTLSTTLLTDGLGNLRLAFDIPSSAAIGPVTVTAKQTLILTYALSQTVAVVGLHPGIQVSPSAVLPGGSLTLYLSGFSPDKNAPISVLTQVFAPGAIQDLTTFVYPDMGGNAVATLQIPGNASPGTITVVASQPASGASVSQQIQILAPRATPPPTSAPTAMPTQTPTPTSTPTPTATATRRPRPLKFKYVTLWYHMVIVGSFNHVDLQANHRGISRVSARISYPNGTRLHFAGNTNPQGRWSKTFRVPKDAVTGRVKTALVQVQLRNGGQTSLERSLTFGLIPQ